MFVNENDDFKARLKGFQKFVRFVLFGGGFLVAVQFAATVMNFYSVKDRQELRENQAKIERLQKELNDAAASSRQMIRGRRVIQTATVEAIKRAGFYSTEEKRAISENWNLTQYGDAKNPFPEYAGQDSKTP